MVSIASVVEILIAESTPVISPTWQESHHGQVQHDENSALVLKNGQRADP